MERSPACQPWPRTGVEWDVAPGLPPGEWYLRDLASLGEGESGGRRTEGRIAFPEPVRRPRVGAGKGKIQAKTSIERAHKRGEAAL